MVKEYTTKKILLLYAFKHDLDNIIYPAWTYAYTGFLILCGIATFFVGTKPVLWAGQIGRVITRSLLLFTSTVFSMVIMQIAYALASAAEVVYFGAIYSVCIDPEYFHAATTATRSSHAIGHFAAAGVGQLFVSLIPDFDLTILFWISFFSELIAWIPLVLLPTERDIDPQYSQSSEDESKFDPSLISPSSDFSDPASDDIDGAKDTLGDTDLGRGEIMIDDSLLKSSNPHSADPEDGIDDYLQVTQEQTSEVDGSFHPNSGSKHEESKSSIFPSSLSSLLASCSDVWSSFTPLSWSVSWLWVYAFHQLVLNYYFNVLGATPDDTEGQINGYVSLCAKLGSAFGAAVPNIIDSCLKKRVEAKIKHSEVGKEAEEQTNDEKLGLLSVISSSSSSSLSSEYMNNNTNTEDMGLIDRSSGNNYSNDEDTCKCCCGSSSSISFFDSIQLFSIILFIIMSLFILMVGVLCIVMGMTTSTAICVAAYIIYYTLAEGIIALISARLAINSEKVAHSRGHSVPLFSSVWSVNTIASALFESFVQLILNLAPPVLFGRIDSEANMVVFGIGFSLLSVCVVAVSIFVKIKRSHKIN
ncbi:Reduced folate carrier like protein [Aduncisulcus paluster]|uniref:Reduced folate carrier like protein n=1 Tax=Aduncisulcus paluster TaxID=2918883 RepID=A0ABQ5K1R2_9EUKA|nr:Reduced folate carrier like protein [Aduncisulcus paluster]